MKVDEQDGWILTFSGMKVRPLGLRPEDVRGPDIAHALANQPRFAGHGALFYSVAEHSVHVSRLVEHRTRDRRAALEGLLHDAAEAYLGDLPGPIKRTTELGRQYQKVERRLQQVIRQAFGLADQQPEMVDLADKAMIWFEHLVLFGYRADFDGWAEFAMEFRKPEIGCWRPMDAEMKFLERLAELTKSADGIDLIAGEHS